MDPFEEVRREEEYRKMHCRKEIDAHIERIRNIIHLRLDQICNEYYEKNKQKLIKYDIDKIENIEEIFTNYMEILDELNLLQTLHAFEIWYKYERISRDFVINCNTTSDSFITLRPPFGLKIDIDLIECKRYLLNKIKDLKTKTIESLKIKLTNEKEVKEREEKLEKNKLSMENIAKKLITEKFKQYLQHCIDIKDVERIKYISEDLKKFIKSDVLLQDFYMSNVTEQRYRGV
jgi:hypothetical protein